VGAFLVGQIAAAGGDQVPTVLAGRGQAGVGPADPADQQPGGGSRKLLLKDALPPR
jgi:hypothetical protein